MPHYEIFLQTYKDIRNVECGLEILNILASVDKNFSVRKMNNVDPINIEFSLVAFKDLWLSSRVFLKFVKPICSASFFTQFNEGDSACLSFEFSSSTEVGKLDILLSRYIDLLNPIYAHLHFTAENDAENLSRKDLAMPVAEKHINYTVGLPKRNQINGLYELFWCTYLGPEYTSLIDINNIDWRHLSLDKKGGVKVYLSEKISDLEKNYPEIIKARDFLINSTALNELFVNFEKVTKAIKVPKVHFNEVKPSPLNEFEGYLDPEKGYTAEEFRKMIGLE